MQLNCNSIRYTLLELTTYLATHLLTDNVLQCMWATSVKVASTLSVRSVRTYSSVADVHNISNSWAVTRWTILATSTLTTSPEAVALQVPPEISYKLSCPSLQSLGSVPSTVLHWEAPIKPSLLPQLLPPLPGNNLCTFRELQCRRCLLSFPPSVCHRVTSKQNNCPESVGLTEILTIIPCTSSGTWLNMTSVVRREEEEFYPLSLDDRFLFLPLIRALFPAVQVKRRRSTY